MAPVITCTNKDGGLPTRQNGALLTRLQRYQRYQHQQPAREDGTLLARLQRYQRYQYQQPPLPNRLHRRYPGAQGATGTQGAQGLVSRVESRAIERSGARCPRLHAVRGVGCGAGDLVAGSRPPAAVNCVAGGRSAGDRQCSGAYCAPRHRGGVGAGVRESTTRLSMKRGRCW